MAPAINRGDEREYRSPDEVGAETEPSDAIEMTKNLRIDLAGSVGVAALGALAVVVMLVAPEQPRTYDVIGPAAVPIAFGIVLIVLSFAQSVVCITGLRKGRRFGIAEGTPDEPGHSSSFRRVVAISLACFLYALAVPRIGFLIATPIAVGFVLYLMGYRNPWSNVGVSLGFTAGAYAIFVMMLKAPIPAIVFIQWSG